MEMIELNELQTQSDYTVKIILLGDEDTGKTAFLHRLVYNEFSLNKEGSIGVEVGIRYFESMSSTYKVEIWDACGDDKSIMHHNLYTDNAIGNLTRSISIL